jgi:hypothetical protein
MQRHACHSCIALHRAAAATREVSWNIMLMIRKTKQPTERLGTLPVGLAATIGE